MDNEKFNTYCSLIFVELAFTSTKFIKQLSEKYKELHDIIVKLVETPSTENQEHLQSLFSHNEESLKKYVHDYLIENESEFNWTTFLDKYEVTPVAGRFFKIDKTEQAYADLIQKMKTERWVFSYMNVAVEENSYVVFFA
tara:strand:+ start:1040 stop:1459 length:420 start_codon:yes stop_codon:yes gene_type:complete